MESRPTSSHGLSQPARPGKDPKAFPITSSLDSTTGRRASQKVSGSTCLELALSLPWMSTSLSHSGQQATSRGMALSSLRAQCLRACLLPEGPRPLQSQILSMPIFSVSSPAVRSTYSPSNPLPSEKHPSLRCWHRSKAQQSLGSEAQTLVWISVFGSRGHGPLCSEWLRGSLLFRRKRWEAGGKTW